MKQLIPNDVIITTECPYDDVQPDVGVIQHIYAIEMSIDRDIGDDFDEMYDNPRLLHGIMGTQTELGELIDAYKKHWFYHKELDVVNVLEELFDVFFYVVILESELKRTFYGTRELIDNFAKLYDSSLEDITERGVAKLKARYPEGFKKKAALVRDLDLERKILEA